NRPRRDAPDPRSLAAGLRHGHDLQQVPVRILEVEAPSAPAGVDLAVLVIIRLAAIEDFLGLDPLEYRFELRITDVEGVLKTPPGARIETRSAPILRLVGEVESQALVDLDLREVAWARLDRQSEDVGEESGRGDLVLRGNNGVIQSNRHDPPPGEADY